MKIIWPLGDSITLGVGNPVGLIPGYRGTLCTSLVSWAFVGSLFDAPPIDQNINRSSHHNGHSGYKIEQLTTLIPTVVPDIAIPDVVTLLIGTNNCSTDTSEQMLTKLLALLTTLNVELPTSKILVSSIPLMPGYESVRNGYNAGIPEVVAASSNAVFIDACGEFTTADQGTLPGPAVDPHPNAQGYLKIANAFEAGILALQL
jgi:lysophospholipase L1-like esterase